MGAQVPIAMIKMAERKNKRKYYLKEIDLIGEQSSHPYEVQNNHMDKCQAV
jgi:hypothetical protein